MKSFRLIALILALIIAVALLVACDSEGDNDLPDGSDASDTGSSNENGNQIGQLDTEKLVVFSDGAYRAYIAREELADETDRLTYGDLRAAIKNKVGSMAKAATDYDDNIAGAPAILIGETKFEESEALYATLRSGEAAAKFINGKYVIAYTSSQGASKLIKKVVNLVNACEKGNVVIDSSWDLTVSYAETIGYTEEQLKSYIEVPEYNGRKFSEFSVDLGQNSVMHIAKRTNAEEYDKYITSLYAAGFKYYTSNTIGNNEYFTFSTDSQIVTAMYLDASKETRVIVDNRANYALPRLERDNDYAEVTDPSFTVTGIGATGWPGGMGYVYKLVDGTFFIIDGGIDASNSNSTTSAMWLFATLQELADDPDNIVISGWLITHIHVDHLGAFVDMAKDSKYTDKITVKKVIYNQPNDREMSRAGISDRVPWMQRALNVWKPESIIKAHPGQVYYFCDLKVTVLGSQDILMPDTNSSHNNLSVVTMVEYNGFRALYLGDAEGLMNAALEKHYGDNLECEILQLAHHGYNGTGAGPVYKIADPIIVLWPVNTAHYKGIVKNVSFNQMFFEPGVTNHVAGETNMTIKDFISWEPEERWKPKLS
ncbi:MAG: hypothetical protein IIV11_06700 [Clostridia bacterium]|nr:hypothetical protein [Clostridia bacterium]